MFAISRFIYNSWFSNYSKKRTRWRPTITTLENSDTRKLAIHLPINRPPFDLVFGWKHRIYHNLFPTLFDMDNLRNLKTSKSKCMCKLVEPKIRGTNWSICPSVKRVYHFGYYVTIQSYWKLVQLMLELVTWCLFVCVGLILWELRFWELYKVQDQAS